VVGPSVLHRSAPKRLKLRPADRILWGWLRRVWADWKSALLIMKPETVIAWHRKGFRLYGTWKVRRGKTGRLAVPLEVRDLIRMMSRNNPMWGAPRIHGELLKLGIEITEPTVAKYTPPELTSIFVVPVKPGTVAVITYEPGVSDSKT
jgi:putative transposase